jgi:hypothetical protein
MVEIAQFADTTLREQHTIVSSPIPNPNLPDIDITLEADPTKQYVAGGAPLWYGTPVRVMPWPFDDATIEFGDDLYERMLYDSEVYASVDTLISGILSDGVEFPPAVSDKLDPLYEQAKEIRQFIEDMFDNLDPDLDETLHDMGGAVATGSRVGELVYRMEDSGKWAGKLVLESVKVKPRRASAFVVDHFMNTLGLLSLIPGRGTPVIGSALSASLSNGSIISRASTSSTDSETAYVVKGAGGVETPVNLLPRSKFAVLTWMVQNGDPRGRSSLRPAYGPWYEKMQTIPEYLKWLAQFASPTIFATTAEKAQNIKITMPDGSTVTKTAEQLMGGVLQNIKNGSFLIFPYGAVAKPLHVPSDGAAFYKAFERFDRDIAKAILNQELATGEGQHDSRAAAQVHQDILSMKIKRGKKAFARMLYRDIIRQTVAINFGDKARDLAPAASLGEVGEEDKSARMTAVASWMREGAIMPSQLPELYAEMDLPQASPEELTLLADKWLPVFEVTVTGSAAITEPGQAPPAAAAGPDASTAGTTPKAGAVDKKAGTAGNKQEAGTPQNGPPVVTRIPRPRTPPGASAIGKAAT